MEKRYIVTLIILLVIGFASVSTILYINGKTNIGANLEDYSIYFSEAYIDDEERLDVISEDKQKITINTKVLKDIGDSEKLEYDVTNASKQYDAKVSITCEPTENEYYEMEHVFENEIIKARTYETGYIIIKLKKVSVEEQDIEFTCTLKVEALEKTKLNTSRVKTRCEYDEGQVWTFDYKGSQQSFEVPCDGEYKLEVWGAQGGDGKYQGGSGGYSRGNINLTAESILYVVVGGAGQGNGQHGYRAGGYNGGGAATSNSDGNTRQASGGGATHIATIGGLLSTLSTKKESILIVAGGGGGSSGNNAIMYVSGGTGGGTNGGNGTQYCESYANYCALGLGASQTAGGRCNSSGGCQVAGTFGQGGSCPSIGGGGGYFGGGACSYSGGGGSGYLSTSLIAGTTSSTNGQRTGNGYARITLVNIG